MKKTIILIIIFFLIPGIIIVCKPISKKSTNDNFDFEKGTFVYYHDTRGNQNRLTGLVYIENDVFICRTYDLSSDNELVVSLSIKKIKDGFDIRLKNTIKGEMTKEITQYVIIDFLNIGSQFSTANLDKYPEDVIKVDPWPEFGYTLEHRFSYWVPLFNLNNTKMKDNDKILYKLVQFGKINTEEELKAFLLLKSLPDEQEFFTGTDKNLNLKIEETNEKKYESNGSILTLDENWIKKDKTKEMPVEFFIISKFSMRDAQINTDFGNISKFKLNDPLEFMKNSLFFYSEKSGYIFPESVKLYNKDSKTFLEFDMIDKTTKFTNKMIFGMINIKNTNYAVITFTSFKEVYETNKEYFDKIINNIKVK